MIPGRLVGYRPPVYAPDEVDCPVIADVDLLVIGGSQSGVAAAVSFARACQYLKYAPGGTPPTVLLVEQNTYLGGQSVTNMVTQWEIPAFRLNVGKWQIRGLGLEMVERVVALGGSDQLWADLVSLNRQADVSWPAVGPDRHLTGEEGLNPEAIKLVLLEMCDEAGVELLLDARAVAPVAVPAGFDRDQGVPPGPSLALLPGSEPVVPLQWRARGAIVEHFAGRGAILARAVIDASANGLVPWWLCGDAGSEVRPPKRRGLTQSYVWIGGVDVDRLVDWVLALPPGVFEIYPADPAQLRAHVATGRLVWFKSRAAGQPSVAFEAADETENLDVLFKAGYTPVGFYFKWVGAYPGHGLFAVDGPYYREDSLDGQVWTSEHTRNLYGSWGLFRIMRHIPGFEHAYLARTCERMGLRTTRVPRGLYRITGDDLKDHAEQPDAIGVADWHDVSHEGETGTWGYHVPFRALVSAVVDDLLFCGRAVSFAPAAMNAHRGIGTTIVCGQGAGAGAAVALARDTSPHQVDVDLLQEVLAAQDVVFTIPHVPPSREGESE